MPAAIIALCNLLWGVFVIGGCGWLVFFQDRSGWWFALAVALWAGGSMVFEKKAETP